MSPNYAAQCAIKCGEPLFVQFLADASKIPSDTPDFAVTAVRDLIGISPRRQLNTDTAAQEQWKKVLNWFGKWRVGYGKDRPPFVMGQHAHERNADREENPFDPHEGDIDRPYDLWMQGWFVAKWREEFDIKLQN